MKKLIKKYQKNNKNKGRCKHIPSCSNYGLECYEKFNFFKASLLTGYRIIRCNPFSKNPYDPVPLNKEEKRIKLEEIKNILDDQANCFTYIKNTYIINNKHPIQEDLEYIYQTATNIYEIYSDEYYNFYDAYLYLIKIKVIKRNFKKSKKQVYNFLLKK